MNIYKNKRLLAKACRAMKIPVDPHDSAYDLYEKVICTSGHSQSVSSTSPAAPKFNINKNKKLLAKACRAMKISVDLHDSAFDLYEKVVCVPPQEELRSPIVTVLNQADFKASEMERISKGKVLDARALSEIERRWNTVRSIKLEQFEAYVFVSNGQPELAKKLKANFRLVVRESAGSYYAIDQSAIEKLL